MLRVVKALSAEMTVDTVNILVGHLTVFGGVAGGGERQAHIFGYAIPAGVFPGHLSYVALGHLHRQQKMPHSGAVWYSGSPLQLDFGEVDDAKGALIIDTEPGLPSQVTSVALTSGTRLITITGTVDSILSRADEVLDAHVRVQLEEKPRVGLADKVREAIPGAVEVVLESPGPPRQKRENRQSLQPIEAFHNFLVDKNKDDPAVESLFAELLDEASL
jgi:exonuclease SbcD